MITVTEPTHTTSKGWDVLYRNYRDTSTLALAIVDGKTWSAIRWDLLQLNPVMGRIEMPEEVEKQLGLLWATYITRIQRKPPANRYCFTGVFGSLPVLKVDSYDVALKVRALLATIVLKNGLERWDA